MLRSLLDLLTNPAPVPDLDAGDARIATTALLVRVARADGNYDPREIKVIREAIATCFDLDDAAADALLKDAETLEANTGDTVSLTRLIKDGVPFENRIDVVELLWEVVLADAKRTDDENAFLRLVVGLIGVTDQESGLARQRVATSGAKPSR